MISVQGPVLGFKIGGNPGHEIHNLENAPEGTGA